MLNTVTRAPASPSGPALVFLHYYGGSVRSWDAVLDLLAPDFQCLAIDLPGFGDSPPLSDHQTVDEVADAVAAVISAQLGNRPSILIGHSMGGKIALAVAAGTLTRPPLPGLQSLLLLAPSPPGPEPISPEDRQGMLSKSALFPAKQRKAAEQTAAKITRVPIAEVVRQQIITDNLRSSPEGWIAWLTTGSLDDITARMVQINVPVSILAGDQDEALPHSVQADMVQPYLPQATLHLVPGAGHLLPQEVPQVVVKAVRVLWG